MLAAWDFLSTLVGLKGCSIGIGDTTLEAGRETAEPSTQLVETSFSSFDRRRLRGRKVVELSAEAVVEESVMAVEANRGLQIGLT